MREALEFMFIDTPIGWIFMLIVVVAGCISFAVHDSNKTSIEMAKLGYEQRMIAPGTTQLAWVKVKE